MTPDFATSHSIVVKADAQACYDCLRRVDMGRSPLARALLAVRGLRHFRTLQSLLDAGFVLVEDHPPRRLTLGFVGKPWRPGGHLVRVAGPDLIGFNEPGFVKVLWSFELAGDDPTTISTKTEVFATDAGARRRFSPYWRVVSPFSGVIRRSMLSAIEECAGA